MEWNGSLQELSRILLCVFCNYEGSGNLHLSKNESFSHFWLNFMDFFEFLMKKLQSWDNRTLVKVTSFQIISINCGFQSKLPAVASQTFVDEFRGRKNCEAQYTSKTSSENSLISNNHIPLLSSPEQIRKINFSSRDRDKNFSQTAFLFLIIEIVYSKCNKIDKKTSRTKNYMMNK